jgi:predicted nucleic acid-binding protein
MRIFLDANVLFSAAKSDGAVRRLLDLLLDARHELWVDGYVVEEARRNLSAKAPVATETLATILTRCRVVNTMASNVKLDESLPLPPKDRPVLAAAIRLRCQVLVTGDRTHFGGLYGMAIQGVTVHSPRSVAELLLR